MPTGYAGMILLSVIPPLWFKVMDPLVEETERRVKHYAQTGEDPFKEVLIGSDQ
jgi:alkane 1-monooxygenase